ncbi:glutamate racemase [Sinomicrobium soli]|uniref:glutamate racemase n=1 Tax=Sinomicrobium sp. N-1-3-6 TaxID=2219864 RepID=UPI000DCC5382|nr:aspartate/glutamate racemase family protein [Sinomicrobium sp. N-1-3-6]RAV29653.1 Asp/Glu/hydantoin racemase [Sinomicrobium sp. N-1-3-6]
MKKILLPVFSFLLLFTSCKNQSRKQEDPEPEKALSVIEQAILQDKQSPFYIDFGAYGHIDKNMAIGVFDSGTGGLTVLDALVRYDENDNESRTQGRDGAYDFVNEKFIYLADQANMPYGNYHSENKSDLLREHIIKDVQFLLADRYYAAADRKTKKHDKEKIKAVVVACNTATAYGMKEIGAFLEETDLGIPVIGVIDAGARGVLNEFGKQEDGAIGVFATVGTIASEGYENTIIRQKNALGYTGNIQVFNQGGHGVAEAIDGEPDFIDKAATSPRDNYRGPDLDNEHHAIDRTLMEVYNFDFDHGKMLCDNENTDDCRILQINDTENYIRYHLVSLMEKIRQSENAQPLKALVLGCTHYPYMTGSIQKVFEELYDYKGDGGDYVYRDLMAEEIKIIDPAVYVAKELYDTLKEKNLLNDKADMFGESEFYISVPNTDNQGTALDRAGKFTYDYKYGREAGNIQEYVKRVPFSRQNISGDIIERLRTSVPATFKMISGFNNRNPKLEDLPAKDKIQ